MSKVREIRPEMVKYIDAKLMDSGLAKHHVQNKNPRGLMVEAARVLVGITEKTGKNDGFYVELIQDTVGGVNNEAWCMATQQTLLAYVELKTGIKSPLLATEHCTTLWMWVLKNRPDLIVKYNPLAGALAIWKHGKTAVEKLPAGHTEMVLDCDEKVFHAVGGNTTGWFTEKEAQAGKRVNREGNSLVYTLRSRAGDGDMELLGFIKPY